MAEMVAADLEAVGITTELRPQPFDAYKEFVVSGDQELFSFGWIGAYSSPDAYLAPLFGSAANDNLTRFRSELVDRFLLEARADDDADTLAARWAQAEGRILSGWVVVPIAQFRTQVVVADRVEGFTHAVDGTVDWSQVALTS
jgi:ABC-type oligopeptide transport system substrate-binding subunit